MRKVAKACLIGLLVAGGGNLVQVAHQSQVATGREPVHNYVTTGKDGHIYTCTGDASDVQFCLRNWKLGDDVRLGA